MLTDRALAAFRDAFIEADRGNVTLNVDVERNENPIIVELSIRDKRRRAGRAGGGGDGARARQHQLVRRRRRDGGPTRGGEMTAPTRLGSTRVRTIAQAAGRGEVQQPGAVDDDGQGERA